MPPMEQPTRAEAWDLVCDWVESDSLRKHLLGVEAAMRAYARQRGGDEELWGVTGLVHALLLRIQALLLPIKTLVLSGH